MTDDMAATVIIFNPRLSHLSDACDISSRIAEVSVGVIRQRKKVCPGLVPPWSRISSAQPLWGSMDEGAGNAD